MINDIYICRTHVFKAVLSLALLNYLRLLKSTKKKFRDNYSKPTCGMICFHFAYPWFKTLHFAHLRLLLLAFRNRPLRFLLEKTYFWAKKDITRIKKLGFFITHELQWEQMGGTNNKPRFSPKGKKKNSNPN